MADPMDESPVIPLDESQSPTDRARSENILTLTGISIALSTFVFFFSYTNSSHFSFYFAPPVSALTVAYHGTLLFLSRRCRSSRNVAPYLTTRPAIGLAVFLLLMWLATIGFMITSLVLYERFWWDLRYLVPLWAQSVLAIVEAGFMLAIVVLCALARKSLAAAEQERLGQIQI